MNTTFIKTLVAALLWTICIGALQADPVADAVERMKQRLMLVDERKFSGEFGEGFDGYLVARHESLGVRVIAALEAENADRRIIYAAIARRTGQSVEQVGRQRFLRIAELAAPGVWLQRSDGSWYQKSE